MRSFLAASLAASLVPIVLLTAARQDESWSMQRTLHFNIHSQSAQEPLVEAIAAAAEQTYARISRDLRHDLAIRVPVIVVARDADLPRTREEASALVTASGAAPVDHLMISAETFVARPSELVHELTHQFVFELLPQAERQAPWVTEALPDHQSGIWDASELARIRDAGERLGVPAIETLTRGDRQWGHAALDFVAAEYGADGVRTYLAALRETPSTSPAVVASVFGVTSADFNRAFAEYVASRLGSR
jgi:hypothetical protein